MLNRLSREDLFSPFTRSIPFNQGNLHQSSSQNDSVQIKSNHLNSSDAYHLNQNQTHRQVCWKKDHQSIKIIKNTQNTNTLSHQLTSYKLNRIPSISKTNQIYKNPHQTNTNLVNQKSQNQKISSPESDHVNYSQNKSRILAFNNQRNPDRNEPSQNQSRITSRAKSGHLVNLGNPISFKPSPSMLSCNRNVKHSSLNQEQSSVNINNKQNNQPNSVYSSQSEYQNRQNLKKFCNGNNHQNQQRDSMINQGKSIPVQDPLCYRNVEIMSKNKLLKSGSELLLPIVNTETGDTHRQSDMNFRSNSIIDESSISPLCESSRISHQETEIAYLKQKLIQTHTKLIKQLEISKQLEDNFFSLKKKYQNLLNSNKNSKSTQVLSQKIQQLETQLKTREEQLNIKEKQWGEKQIRFLNSAQQLQKKQLQLLAQCEEKQAQFAKLASEWEKKQIQMKKQSFFFNQKMVSFKQQMNQMSHESVRLNQQIITYKTSFQKLLSENLSLRSRVDPIFNDQDYLRQKISQFKLNNYSSRDLQQILQSKEIITHQQIDEKNTLAQQNRQLLLKNQGLKTDLETMRNKVLSLTKHNQQISDELQQFTNSISNYSTQLSLLEQRLALKQKQYLQKEELCQIWRKKYSDSQQDSIKNQQIIIKHQKEEKQLKNHNSELNIALRQQKEKNAQMLSQIINIQMENKELKSKMHALQQQKKQLQDKLFEATPQKNTLHQKQELELQIQKLTTQYNTLSTIINKKDKEISELKNQVFEAQSLISKLSLKEKQFEKRSQQLDQWSKQLELKQRNFLEQKVTKINSVKSFVNQLEDQKDRSVALKKTNQQINRQNRAQTPHHIQRQNVFNHSNLKIASFNDNNSRCLSISPTNSKITSCQNKRSKKSSQEFEQNQLRLNQNTCITPSKSLNNLNVKNLLTHNFDSFKNSQVGSFMNSKMNQQNTKQNHQDFNLQNNCFDYQSYEDSLQTNNLKSNMIANQYPQNQDQFQIQQHCTQISTNKNRNQLIGTKSVSVTPLKQSHTDSTINKTKMGELKISHEGNKFLSSYKEEKEHYMCLLDEIGEMELQSYNLGQQKKNILDELEKIQNTKVKTKDIIGRRRQLEMRLLGNEKKNNQVKDKLKAIRGKVV